MATKWSDYEKTLNLSDEDNEMINTEMVIIDAVIKAKEEKEPKQSSKIYGMKRSKRKVTKIV